jgi:phosphoribosylformylglycinamidine cyclo-ligase
MIGTVPRGAVLDGSAVVPGDVVLGLGSSGLHTNGYSLARRVLARSGLTLTDRLPGGAGETLGGALLAPHRWYGPALLPVLESGNVRGAEPRVHALAHVTGGGLAGNLERLLPLGCRARISPAAWPRPVLFRWLIEAGEIPEDDARSAFNLGVGMTLVCAPAEAPVLARELSEAGERVFEIGVIAAGERGVEWEDGS